MRYRRLADTVVVVHLGVVAFMVAGLLAVFWRPWLAWVHLSIILYVATIYIAGVRCPLTVLENRFRRAGGQSGYDGGFLDHYLARAVRFRRWERFEPWIGAAVLIGNAAIYAYRWMP